MSLKFFYVYYAFSRAALIYSTHRAQFYFLFILSFGYNILPTIITVFSSSSTFFFHCCCIIIIRWRCCVLSTFVTMCNKSVRSASLFKRQPHRTSKNSNNFISLKKKKKKPFKWLEYTTKNKSSLTVFRVSRDHWWCWTRSNFISRIIEKNIWNHFV